MTSEHRPLHDWLVGMIGAILLAGGMVALALPVLLDDYDSWGFQIDCGNGYHSRLQQAVIDDQNPDVLDRRERTHREPPLNSPQ